MLSCQILMIFCSVFLFLTIIWVRIYPFLQEWLMYILYTIYKLAILGKFPTDEPIGRHIYTPTNLDHVKT